MEESNPCSGCSLCCRYVALEIDKPEDEKDIDQIKWFLIHKNVWVFIDHDDSWNVQFNTPCENLDGHLCSIHPKYLNIPQDKRPLICQEYSTDSCERYGDGNSYKLLWKNRAEFEEWLLKNKSKILIADTSSHFL